jgi:hypothetical protein
MPDAVTTSSVLGNLAGLIVLLCTFAIPVLSREFRRDRRMAAVFWVALLIRQTLAVSMGLISGPLSDAGWFHLRARESGLAGLVLRAGSEFYERLLGAVYDILGSSPLLAAELSVLAFAASMVVFANLMRELGVARHRAGLLALYALPFSAIFFTSTIMREGCQLLGLILAVYFVLRFRRTGSLAAIVLACFSAMIAALLHDALLIFSAAFLPLAVLWPIGTRDPASAAGGHDHPATRRAVRYVVLVGLLIAGWRVMSEGVPGSMALGAITSRRALEFAAQFREAGFGIEARTTYGVRLDTSSPGAFVASVAVIFVYYMFAPFPWQIRAPADVLGCVEAVLRLVLLCFALQTWRRTSGADRRNRGLLLLAYFALAGLWSLGTINYGTAYRHHVTTNWLLVLLGGPQLLGVADRTARRVLRTLTARSGYASV